MDFVTTLILFLILVLSVIPLIQNIKKKRKLAEAVDILPGEKCYPLIGTSLNFIKGGRNNFWKIYRARNKTYGPIFRTWLGGSPSVELTKAEFAEELLKSNVNITKSRLNDFLIPWLGNGLVTSTGDQWRTHRRLITPTFHFSILDDFTQTFAEKSELLADVLSTKANGEFFEITHYLSLCTLDTICQTAMGIQINAMTDSKSEYLTAVRELCSNIFYRISNPLLHNDFIFSLTRTGRRQKQLLSILHGITLKIIRERRSKMNTEHKTLSEEEELFGKKRRKTFLDLLLGSNEKDNLLTDDEIRSEVDTFMFAGNDTTSVASTWTLFCLANYPQVQAKVQQELEGIFRGEEKLVTPQDLTEMKYLERVIKEVSRIYPPVPITARRLDEDIIIDGITIPAGVTVKMHIVEFHTDPEQFPDPYRFDPDRFLPENVAKRYPYSYVPFSAGPRNCIGQKYAMKSVKTLIATLLRRYKITKARNTPENIERYMDITLRPLNGLHIALEPRLRKL